MIGGTASSTKWNLINPQNTDAAFRLTFYGAPAFSAAGVLFPTSSDYANTHLADSLTVFDNNAISYYSDTQNSTNGFDMGCSNVTIPYNAFAIYNAIDSSVWFGLLDYEPTPAVTKGLFMNSATATDVKRFDNGMATVRRGAPPTSFYTNLPIWLGSVPGVTYAGQRVCSLATIGYGLSDAQVLTFYHIVQQFENTLGR